MSTKRNSARSRAKKPPRSNKGRRFPAEPLRRDEVERLLAACSRRAPTGRRNRALLMLLWRSGLRITEALDLRTVDLDADRGTIHVRHGKGGKARVVGADSSAFDAVDRWLEARHKLKIRRDAPLFCTLAGQPVSSAYVRAMLPRIARRAGIERRVHAHGLRHTLASELRAEGVDLGVISKQLGHASISTTARYVDHLNPRVVIETMRARKTS